MQTLFISILQASSDEKLFARKFWSKFWKIKEENSLVKFQETSSDSAIRSFNANTAKALKCLYYSSLKETIMQVNTQTLIAPHFWRQ